MSAVRTWLEALGLGQYAGAVEANDIDTDLLARIDDRLPKDIGVSSAGHRPRIRNAVAKPATNSIAEATAASGVAATAATAPRSGRLDRTVGAARSPKSCAKPRPPRRRRSR